ncbi:MAG: dissimilatory-type sulfite reductase subunit alpha [Deltaproteobacteria bacterium]|nr:MAG: dissimilatory-type sulfite reductase subunit alpha [Deltaproteobacteria bacterium]
MATKLRETPLLDELEKGPWPSFVTEIKKSAEAGSDAANDLLGVLERSYKEKIGHWKHGGIVGVMGYGGGVIGRYNDLPDEFPNVAHFHTIRVNQPSGWFYTSDILHKVCDLWEKYGSGLTNFHGSTGDLVLLGCRTEVLEDLFTELTEIGFDLGGSGSDMRTPSCCCGKARCEWACYDTMNACHEITNAFQDELHRPAFPYKYKIKFAGCGNDCVASIARADCSVIGTWKDDIQIDQNAVAEYAKSNEIDIQKHVVEKCPTGCMSFDGSKLEIDNENCVKCMHCINAMPKALAPGKERGATILIGAKAPIIGGALLSSVFVPFIEMEPPYEDFKELTEAIWDLWGEHGKNRERVGEFIQRIGLGNFLEQIGLDPTPEMVVHPRTNPYIFFELDEEDQG